MPPRPVLTTLLGAAIALLALAGCGADNTDIELNAAAETTAVAAELEDGLIDHVTLGEAATAAGWETNSTGIKEGDDPENGTCRYDRPEPCELTIGFADQDVSTNDAVEACSSLRTWALARESDIELEVFSSDEEVLAAATSSAECTANPPDPDIVESDDESTSNTGGDGALAEECRAERNNIIEEVEFRFNDEGEMPANLEEMSASVSPFGLGSFVLETNGSTYVLTPVGECAGLVEPASG